MQRSVLFPWRGKGMVCGWAGLIGLAMMSQLLATAWAADRTGAVSSGPARWTPTDPPNQPIGEAKGIFPGRVVWIYDPQVAKWDGNAASGGWYEDKFTDPVLAEQMLSKALRLLSGAKSDAEAWASLFKNYNSTHGRGQTGYQPGEKVVVKLNLNCCKRRADRSQGLYNTPQLTMAILRQLVEQARVRESDIVAYDASRWVSDAIFNPVHTHYPGIRFEDREGGEGRFKVQPDKKVALHFADPGIPDNGKTYLPACVTGATYLINAAVMRRQG